MLATLEEAFEEALGLNDSRLDSGLNTKATLVIIIYPPTRRHP